MYLCCPESNNKYKFTGSIDASGTIVLSVNVGAGDRRLTFNGLASADGSAITGAFSSLGGTGSGLRFTR